MENDIIHTMQSGCEPNLMPSFISHQRSRRISMRMIAVGVLAGAGLLLQQVIPAAGQPAVTSCVEPAACLAQAVEALSRRDYEKGISLLQGLIEQYPNTLWVGRAELALGKQFQERGDRQAVSYLLAAQQHLPVLGDYALFYRGEADLKASDFNGAATAYDILVERHPDSLLRPQALARSVEAWFLVDDCGRARERQVRFMAEYAGHASAPAVLLRQGDCQYKGNDANAAVTYRRIWTQYAASPQADEAAMRLERLKGEGVAIPELTPEDRWLRAKTLFDAAQYARAVKAFEDHLKSSPVLNRDRSRLNLGISHVRLKRYDEARASFEQVIKGGSESAVQDAVVWLGRVFLRQGLDEPFLALAREVEGGRLSGESRAKFLLLLAAQHADRGRLEKAVQTYQQVGESGEGPAPEGYYRAGWLFYKNGRFEEAARSFDQAIRVQPGGPFSVPALYWKARSLEKSGETQKAAVVFRALCGDAPLSYYCQIARARPVAALTNGVNGASDGVSFAGLDPKERPVAGDAHYQRAVELRMVGLLREAGEEAAVLIGQIGGDRGEILWMAGLLKGFGEYHRALKLVQLTFPDVLERGASGVPSSFWELAYPQGLLPTIQAATTNGVDPYLVAAVIREESVYNPDAVSPAGALGLMQVMPQTGQMVAGRLGGESFSRERLFDPRYNIRLGSWYLGYLAEKFDHNPIYMVAAYNAGPEAVAKWVQQFGGVEPDEFIESIPYTETRLYVKRVLRSHREYRRVSGRECAAPFEKVC
ncbi:MAG: tetratricopeptide repeat protein [Nitrospirae bacterium]|nr:MAG: tetratricopeptide repeat protein [Nitrospirota bacterium]